MNKHYFNNGMFLHIHMCQPIYLTCLVLYSVVYKKILVEINQEDLQIQMPVRRHDIDPVLCVNHNFVSLALFNLSSLFYYNLML